MLNKAPNKHEQSYSETEGVDTRAPIYVAIFVHIASYYWALSRLFVVDAKIFASPWDYREIYVAFGVFLVFCLSLSQFVFKLPLKGFREYAWILAVLLHSIWIPIGGYYSLIFLVFTRDYLAPVVGIVLPIATLLGLFRYRKAPEKLGFDTSMIIKFLALSFLLFALSAGLMAVFSLPESDALGNSGFIVDGSAVYEVSTGQLTPHNLGYNDERYFPEILCVGPNGMLILKDSPHPFSNLIFDGVKYEDAIILEYDLRNSNVVINEKMSELAVYCRSLDYLQATNQYLYSGKITGESLSVTILLDSTLKIESRLDELVMNHFKDNALPSIRGYFIDSIRFLLTDSYSDPTFIYNLRADSIESLWRAGFIALSPDRSQAILSNGDGYPRTYFIVDFITGDTSSVDLKGKGGVDILHFT